MKAHYLNIEAKVRKLEFQIASLNDFELTDGDEVDSEIILSHNVSLYCFDDEAKEAIFVELPQVVDLTTVPFVYDVQYNGAQRLIAVPYDAFRQIAQTLPPVGHLIMTYISGRSGSTLLSHVFNEVEGVMSLSEPDVITQFVHLRGDTKDRDAELRELFDYTVRILFKPNPFKKPTIYALKFRMETVRAIELFQATFPQAKNLYLYRDAVGFVASFYRFYKSVDIPEYFPLNDVLVMLGKGMKFDFMPKKDYFEPNSDPVSSVQFITFFWLMAIEWYLEKATIGIPLLAVRYADFMASRKDVLAAIFEYCDLPVERASQPFKAFERDSQAGSALQRDDPKKGNKLQ
ncbi:MAG: hypothetical protein KC615_25075, partial [Anaerolineae bacterium]|nr:hypothetical protein [Anaerolineae bacterium]